MKIITAHQPSYLPWLGLFHKIAISDIYVYLDNVQFEKNSFTNRNKIKTAQGAIWLTVPVLAKNHFNKTIKELEIDNSQDWRKKHWQSIYLNYKKTLFFGKYSEFIESVYLKDWCNLSDLNDYMMRWFLNELGIETEYCVESESDFKGSKTDLLLDICKKKKAGLYVFGALGKDYAEKEKFDKEGIKIYFQEYNHPQYFQLYKDFLPNMSVLDLLFNCGEKSLEILMSGNIGKTDLARKLNLS